MSDKEHWYKAEELKCFECDSKKFKFDHLWADEELAEYSQDDQVEILLKGLWVAEYICKNCGRVEAIWIYFRKPYPGYEDTDVGQRLDLE